MLPLLVRVDRGVIAMKGYSAFPKAPAFLELNHHIVYCHIQDTRWGRSYSSAELPSVYSAIDRAIKQMYMTIDWTLTGTTTSSHCGSGSNGNEEVLQPPTISKTGASIPEEVFVSYPRYPFF